MAANNNSSFNLRSVLEKEKLNGANFIDWYRNLRIVLRNEKKSMFLSNHILITSLMVQMLQLAKLMRSTAMTHLKLAVSCLPQCPLICKSIMRMRMLIP